MRTLLVLSISAVLATGCASGGSAAGAAGGGTVAPSGAAATAAPRVRSGGANLITAEEVASIDAGNALQLVQRLRPRMLQGSSGVTRAAGKPEPLAVYLDNTRLGGVSALEQIPKAEVQEIRFIGASDATQRWGVGHTSGAIQVVRRK